MALQILMQQFAAAECGRTKNVQASPNMMQQRMKQTPSRSSAAAARKTTAHAGSPLLNGTGSGGGLKRPEW